jgi:hypothetical protein
MERSKNLITAYCKEDLSWIYNDNLSAIYSNIILYNKCNNKIPDKIKKIKNLRIAKQHNSGQDLLAYIDYIIKNYNNLADYNTFIAGAGRHDYFRYDFYKKVVLNTKCYTNEYCLLHKDGLDLDLSINQYQPHNSVDSIPFVKSKYKNLRDFCDNVLGYTPANFSACSYRVTFGVKKESILQHPKNFYIKLYKELDIGANNEICHFIERLFYHIFEQ